MRKSISLVSLCTIQALNYATLSVKSVMKSSVLKEKDGRQNSYVYIYYE